MRVAVMQPYFIPYAGYFRLFAACDVFVIFDCVQFPRRGWVHRNQLLNYQGQNQWLTLPIQKCDQATPIKDLTFTANPDHVWPQRLSYFPQITKRAFEQCDLDALYHHLLFPRGSVLSYLLTLLQEICRLMKLPFSIIRSSDLAIAPDLKGQDRILEICKRFKATSYVNSPNGRDLYCAKTFQHHGIQLEFLSPYQGAALSILHRLLNHPIDEISHDIISQSQPIAC